MDRGLSPPDFGCWSQSQCQSQSQSWSRSQCQSRSQCWSESQLGVIRDREPTEFSPTDLEFKLTDGHSPHGTRIQTHLIDILTRRIRIHFHGSRIQTHGLRFTPTESEFTLTEPAFKLTDLDLHPQNQNSYSRIDILAHGTKILTHGS
jgi:hypothetical protein